MNIEKENTKSIPISAIIFAFLLIARWRLRDDYTLFEMSCLNLVALDYVFFDIFHKGITEIRIRLNNTILPKTTIKRKRSTLRNIGIFIFILIFVVEIIYVYNFGNAAVNDVFTIVALFISVEDEFLKSYIVKIMSYIIKI